MTTTAAPEQIRAARETLHAAPRQERTIALATLLAGLLLAWGWSVREELYWNAERGVGYALGIIGLCCLVALLSYSLRKRHRSLAGLGLLAPWFRVHMLLGILGPTAIVFHANFQLGSVNSSVALLSMLAVAGSGYIGRFFYARVHRGLFGERRVVAELMRDAEEGFGVSQRVAEWVPELGPDFEAFDRWALDRKPSVTGSAIRFFTIGGRRRRLHRRAIQGLRATGKKDLWFLEEAVSEHLWAAQRVAQFGAWERLFSLWHAIHLPLAFLLFTASAVHVVAVHMF